MKNKTSCIIISITIIVILIFAGLLLFIRNRSKIKKLLGGMGSITEYGSTVILDTSAENAICPLAIPKYIEIEHVNKNIANAINEIAKNPLIYLEENGRENIISGRTKFITELKRILSKEEFDTLFINSSDKLNIYNTLMKIFENMPNRNYDFINFILQVFMKNNKFFGDPFYKIQHFIAQRNTDNYEYTSSNNINIDTIIQSPENNKILDSSNNNFRSWYNNSKSSISTLHESHMNIYPRNRTYMKEISDEILLNLKNSTNLENAINEVVQLKDGSTLMTIPKNNDNQVEILDGNILLPGYQISKNFDRMNSNTSQRITRYNIADIYPAAHSINVAYMIYTILIDYNKQNTTPLSNNIIYGTIVMHILIVYIINIYGHFAQYEGYNKSVSDKFMFY